MRKTGIGKVSTVHNNVEQWQMDPFVGHFSRYLHSKGAEGKYSTVLRRVYSAARAIPPDSPALTEPHLSSSDHRSSLQFFFRFGRHRPFPFAHRASRNGAMAFVGQQTTT
jgi:hypothetical protein